MRLCMHCWSDLTGIKNHREDPHDCVPRSNERNLRSHMTGIFDGVVTELEDTGFDKDHILQCIWTYLMIRRPTLATLVRPVLPQDLDDDDDGEEQEDGESGSEDSSPAPSEVAVASALASDANSNPKRKMSRLSP